MTVLLNQVVVISSNLKEVAMSIVWYKTKLLATRYSVRGSQT